MDEHVFLGVIPVDKSIAALDIEPLDGSGDAGGDDGLGRRLNFLRRRWSSSSSFVRRHRRSWRGRGGGSSSSRLRFRLLGSGFWFLFGLCHDVECRPSMESSPCAKSPAPRWSSSLK